MNEPCNHIVCRKLADGTCHINADGWLINVDTPEAQARVGEILGWPDDELGRAIREHTDNGRELVRIAREMLAKPNLSAKDRKAAEKMLESLRQRGISGDEP